MGRATWTVGTAGLLGLFLSCTLTTSLDDLAGGAPIVDAAVDADKPDAATDGDGALDGSGGGPLTLTLVVQYADDVIRVGDTTVELPGAEYSAGTLGGTVSKMTRSGVRYRSVDLPQAAQIISATLTLTARELQTGVSTNTRFSAQDDDDAVPFVAIAADFDARPRTDPIVWNRIEPWAPGSAYTAPDLSPIVQAVVNRPGWAPGNSLVVFWNDNGSTAPDCQRVAYSFTGSPVKAPALTVTYR